MGAGLTEGDGILSRPKEHWHLLVMPLTLIAALNISRRSGRLLGTHVEPLTTSAMAQLAADADVIEKDGLDDGSSAVLYQPLSGQTLRQVLQSIGAPAVREALVERFGKFLAQLHDRGIYFRSVHLGNVLLLDTDEFDLIDLADMQILPSPLNLSLRQRNLRHIQRYHEDRRWLFEEHLQALLQGYGKVAPKRAVDNMRKHVLVSSVKAG